MSSLAARHGCGRMLEHAWKDIPLCLWGSITAVTTLVQALLYGPEVEEHTHLVQELQAKVQAPVQGSQSRHAPHADWLVGVTGAHPHPSA